MITKIFFFVGGGLIAAGILVCIIIGIWFKPGAQDPTWLGMLLQFSIGGFLAGLGLIFILIANRVKKRERKEKELFDQLMLTGISTEGMVTYVDKNYAIRVRNQPIYS